MTHEDDACTKGTTPWTAADELIREHSALLIQ